MPDALTLSPATTAPPEISAGLAEAGVGMGNSQTLLWKYMASIGIYSFIVILLLLGLLWVIKNRPDIINRVRSFFGAKMPAPPPQPKLKVEEVLAVDNDKQLMIIECEHERFLVSSGAEGIHFLTKLNAGQQGFPMPVPHPQEPEPHHDNYYESEAGIRGHAINPTEDGASAPPPPGFKGMKPAFLNAMKDLLPHASQQGNGPRWGQQTPPPFSPNPPSRHH